MTLEKKSWQETARALVGAPDGSFYAGISDDKSTQTGTVGLLHALPSGALDPAFGMNGLVTESGPVGAIDRALVSLAQVPVSNALIFLGRIQGGTWYMGRYSPSSGALDASFGTKGIVTATFGSAGARPAGLMVLPGGQLLVGISPDAWDGVNGVDGNFGLARHQPDGGLDLAFGRLRYRWNTSTPVIGSRVTAVDLQADGKVLLGGFLDRGDGSFNFDFAVMRLEKAPGW